MSDGCWGPDGERLAPYLRRSVDIRAIDRPGTGDGMKIGLVIATHHKDVETNRSGSYTEYDVLLMDHLAALLLYRVPTMGFHLNSDTGDYAILRAATSIPEMEDDTNFYQNFMSSDGDLVIIGFIDNRFPMILGTANHLRSDGDSTTWHTDSTEGEVRVTHHKDSFVKMNEDGSMQIEVKDEMELQITINGVQIFRVWDDAGTLKIDLGDATVDQKLVMGDAFKTWFDLQVAGHKHAAGTLVDSLLAPCTGSTATAVPNLDVSVLTEKVKTQA